MPNYTQMPLAEQITMLEQEEKNVRLLWAKAQMWSNAVGELGQSGSVLERETDEIETGWTDPAGQDFVTRARNTRRLMATWEHNIQTARPQEPLLDIGDLIPRALDLARQNKVLFEQIWNANNRLWAAEHVPVGDRASRDEIEGPYREPSGRLMDQIAELYGTAADAVEQATTGGNYEGVNDVPSQGGPSPQVSGGGGGGGGGAPAGAVNSPLAAGGGPGGAVDPLTGQPVTGPDGQVTSPELGGGPAGELGGAPVGADGLTGGADALSGGGGDTGAGSGSPAGADPELSGGLGAAPATAPSLSGGAGGGGGGGLPATGLGGGAPTPIVSSPITGGGGSTSGNRAGGGGPGGGGGGPTPIVSSPPITGVGGGSGTGGIGGSGSGSGAGVRIPGVSVSNPLTGGGGVGGGGVGGGVGGFGPAGGGAGGAGSQIPAAATPYQAPATASPSTGAPVVPPSLASTSGASAAGAGGGMPPMMPPMGGMGGMGAGGGPGPGSGAASRPGGNRNRRKEVVTPGLPTMLSGKAGQADMNAFAGRGRKRVEESDVPTTVQLIDEDLWQVEQKPAAEERIAAPVRHRAH